MKRYILLAVLLVPNIALAKLTDEQTKILLNKCKERDCLVKILVDVCTVAFVTGFDDERDLLISVRDLNVYCACRVNRTLQGLSAGDCPKILSVERRDIRRAGFQ
jgi:hypothetical protein